MPPASLVLKPLLGRTILRGVMLHKIHLRRLHQLRVLEPVGIHTTQELVLLQVAPTVHRTIGGHIMPPASLVLKPLLGRTILRGVMLNMIELRLLHQLRVVEPVGIHSPHQYIGPKVTPPVNPSIRSHIMPAASLILEPLLGRTVL